MAAVRRTLGTEAWDMRCNRGMTWAELLIAVMLVAVIAAFILPVIAQYTNGDRRRHDMATEMNMRQISYGILQYMQDNEEKLPRAGWDCLDSSSDKSFKRGDSNQCGGNGWQDVIGPYVNSKSIFLNPDDKSEAGDGPWGAGTGTDFNTTDGNFSILYNDLLAHKMPTTRTGYADPAHQNKHADGFQLSEIRDPSQCLMICEGHGGWDRCSTKTPPTLAVTDWTGSTDLQNKWHHDYTITGNCTFLMATSAYSGLVMIRKGLPFYESGGGNVAYVDGHCGFKLYSTATGLPALCKSLPWTEVMDPKQRNVKADSCRDPDNPLPGGWGGGNWF
jgi:prepilin-type processing-associated H-X9-DG protein